MLGERFLYGDALIYCFPFGFLVLDGLMVREMFYIFWMIIGRWVLRLWRAVELL